jgi:hypothetical protein
MNILRINSDEYQLRLNHLASVQAIDRLKKLKFHAKIDYINDEFSILRLQMLLLEYQPEHIRDLHDYTSKNLVPAFFFEKKSSNEDYEVNVLLNSMKLIGADYITFSDLNLIETDNLLYEFDITMVKNNHHIL